MGCCDRSSRRRAWGRTFDLGYAVTSHSSQGQTADRVLVHVTTEHSSAQLVNRRLAYVAVSRGRFDAQIYTDDKARLGDALQRDSAHRSAIEPLRATGAERSRERAEHSVKAASMAMER